MKHPIRILALLAVCTLLVVALGLFTSTPKRALADAPTPTPSETATACNTSGYLVIGNGQTCTLYAENAANGSYTSIPSPIMD
jgi:hypothetical protein